MKNPFIYGHALSPCDPHIARPDLYRHLRGIAKSHGRTVLLGDRRVGKSSSVPLALQGTPLVTIDCYGCRSTADFLERARFALADTEHTLPAQWAKLRESIQGFKVSLTGLELHGGLSNGSLMAMLQALDRFGQTSASATVFFDEFQDLLKVGSQEEARSVLGLLRGQIQRHTKTAYVFAGSARKELNAMFMSHQEPFYHSATIFDVKPIGQDDLLQFLATEFARTTRKLTPEVAITILSICKCVTSDCQHLASYVWNETPAGATASMTHLRAALNLLLDHLDRYLTDLLTGATELQEKLLFGLACHESAAVTSKEFLLLIGAKSRSAAATAARHYCTGDNSVLCQVGTKYTFLDRFIYLGLVRRLLLHPVILRTLKLDIDFTPDPTLAGLLGRATISTGRPQ